MRTMKESNYQRFRQLLSDPAMYGDEVLALLAEHGEQHLGLAKAAYDMVYEGFWDLYCKKPHASAEIPTKKLEGFIQKVRLVVPPADTADEEGNVTPSVTKLPLKAIIRIRIPMNRPKASEPADDEAPEDVDKEAEDAKKVESMPGSARNHEHQQLSTHPDEDQTGFTEQPVEDKVLTVTNVSDGMRVWAIHQAAQRAMRRDLATVLKKTVKELDEVELEEFVAGVEDQANEVEKRLVRIFSLEGTNEYDEIRAKYLNGSTAPIPTFDYEPAQ